MPRCWMRRIRIELISKLNSSKIVLGDNKHEKIELYPELRNVNINSATKLNDDLNITISGEKHAATTKDSGKISIYNLSYATIVKLCLYEYYKIRIYVGYESQEDLFLIFDGSVSFISNKIHSNHDTECYILYASDIVAQFSQNRMNFSFTSSLNIYSAVKYICLTNGISNYHLDAKLKNQFLRTTVNEYSNCATILDSSTLNSNNSISSDGIGAVIDITTSSGKRKIHIDKMDMLETNPQLSSEGLTMALLPTFDWKVGDVICIDNALIDISQQDTSSFNANFLDKNGEYIIKDMTYTFQNRGQNFAYNIKARAVSVLEGITGGATSN